MNSASDTGLHNDAPTEGRSTDAERRERPGTQLNLDREFRQLNSRIEKTYHSRIQACKRLEQRGSRWSAALVLASIASLSTSVALLVDSRALGAHGDAVMVVIGVVVMGVSLMLASANYPNRANEYFKSYRALQRLSVEVEHRSADTAEGSARKVLRQAATDYQELLDASPNHTTTDYRNAFPPRLKRREKREPNDCHESSPTGSEAAISNPSAATSSRTIDELRPIVGRLEYLSAQCNRLLGATFSLAPIVLCVISILMIALNLRWILDAS